MFVYILYRVCVCLCVAYAYHVQVCLHQGSLWNSSVLLVCVCVCVSVHPGKWKRWPNLIHLCLAALWPSTQSHTHTHASTSASVEYSSPAQHNPGFSGSAIQITLANSNIDVFFLFFLLLLFCFYLKIWKYLIWSRGGENFLWADASKSDYSLHNCAQNLFTFHNVKSFKQNDSSPSVPGHSKDI